MGCLFDVHKNKRSELMLTTTMEKRELFRCIVCSLEFRQFYFFRDFFFFGFISLFPYLCLVTSNILAHSVISSPITVGVNILLKR